MAKHATWNLLVVAATVVACLGLTVAPGHAANWNYAGGGSWADTTKWDTGVPPNGVDQVANFVGDTPDGTNVDWDITSVSGTVGTLLFQDTGPSANSGWELQSGSLTLDVSSGSALINYRESMPEIHIPVTLNDDLDITYTYTTANHRANLNQPITSGTGLTTNVDVNRINPWGTGSYGRVVFAGSNTFNGDLTVHHGMLQLQNNNAIPDAANVTVNSGASLRLLYNYTESIDGLFGNGNVQVWSASATDNATLNMGSAGGDGDFSGLVREEGTTGYTLSLQKSGAGTQILRGTNTYHGTTTVSEGVLAITNASALGSTAAGTTVANFASLEVSGGITCAEPITINGGGHPPATSWYGALRSTGGDNTWSGPITLGSSSRIGCRTANTFSLTGGITGSGTASFVGTTGSVIRIADNPINITGSLYAIDYNVTLLDVGGNAWGSTLMSYGGTLRLGLDDPMPAATVVTIGSSNNTSGTFDLNGHSQTIGGLHDYGTGSRRVLNSNGGTPTLTIDTTGTYTYAGLLGVAGQDSFNLVKAGTGTQTLSGANAYTGTTTVSGGTLLIGDPAALGSGSSAIQLCDASTGANDVALLTDTWGTSGYLTYTRNINVNNLGTGTVTIGTNAPDSSGRPVEFNGTITLGRDVLIKSINVDRTSFRGKITGPGGVEIIGPKRVTFASSASDYAGDTVISGGSLQLYSDAVPATSDVYVNTASGFLLWNTNATIDGLFGTGPTRVGYTARTLTVGSGGGSCDYSGALGQSSGGQLALTKAGGGTQILRGVSSYTGPTTVAGGTLHVFAGASIGNSTVTIAPGATLKGGGTTGPVVVQGTIEPGDCPGTLTTGTETWSGGGIYTWEINQAAGTQGTDPGWDWLNVQGSLDILATTTTPFVIDIDSLALDNSPAPVHDFNPNVLQSWTIATAADGVTGFDTSKFVLDDSSFQGALPGEWFRLGLGGDGHSVVLTYAVPEPATMSLLGLGSLLLAARRRRR